ncbi:hypothetical protein FJD35_14945 [Pseudomonas mandelii]|nr:hypothetical protein [Pseudomonas mandelii]TWS09639.1 hypothetical protein FJD35_14945 [Pseudomonas mandelii]
MGASLLTKAVGQALSMLDVPTSSRAGSLLQGTCLTNGGGHRGRLASCNHSRGLAPVLRRNARASAEGLS